jgi:hypothetical protein
MKVVQPLKLTGTQYAQYPTEAMGYSNATDYPAWNIATAYVPGDRVIVDSLQSQFECISAHTGTAPTLIMTTPWVRIGATNAWRAFDKVISAPFVGYDDALSGHGIWYNTFVVTGIKERFNTVAVLETNAVSCTVIMRDQLGALVYEKTMFGSDNSGVVDHWQYCFGEVVVRRAYIVDDIPGWGTASGSGARLEITLLTATGGTDAPILSVGEIVIGNAIVIGKTMADPVKRLVDYSVKEPDQYGNIVVVPRAYAYEADFDIKIEPARKVLVDNLAASIRSIPCLFFPSAEEGNQNVYIYGYIGSLDTAYSTPEYIHATLQVKGLT